MERYITPARKDKVAGQTILWIAFWTTDFWFTYGFYSGNVTIVPFIFNALTNTSYFYICVFYIILPTFSKSKALTIIFILILLLAFVFAKMGVEKFLNTGNYTNIVARKGSTVPYLSFELWRYSYMTFFLLRLLVLH
ncbi:MAG: hypothetical protein LRY55_12120 [Leadbetterella sp.]|nr:hypothetical protein [Leadbetterella sp.]